MNFDILFRRAIEIVNLTRADIDRDVTLHEINYLIDQFASYLNSISAEYLEKSTLTKSDIAELRQILVRIRNNMVHDRPFTVKVWQGPVKNTAPTKPFMEFFSKAKVFFPSSYQSDYLIGVHDFLQEYDHLSKWAMRRWLLFNLLSSLYNAYKNDLLPFLKRLLG